MKVQEQVILHELGRERMKVVVQPSAESAETLYKAVISARVKYFLLLLVGAGLITLAIGAWGLLVPIAASMFIRMSYPIDMNAEELALARQWGCMRRKLRKLPAFRMMVNSLNGVSGESLHRVIQFQECVTVLWKLKNGTKS